MKESALVPSTSQIVEKPKRILSAELEKKLEINSAQIYEMGGKVKKYKKRLNETEEIMDDMLGKGTQQERLAVEEAMARLKDKIMKIKNEETYKSLEKEAEYLETKLNIVMENVFPHYSRAIKKIYGSYENKEERSQKLLEFHQVVGDAFLTKDEKKVLSVIKSQMKQIVGKEMSLITL